MERPVFLYDISSAYAYLAAERIDELIPGAEWRPILLGGLFKLNGRTSWAFTNEREARQQEISERAAQYGLPAVSFPTSFPESLLNLARAATVARQQGRVKEFSLAGFRAIYVHGGDPSGREELARLAGEARLDPEQVLRRINDQDVKDELRQATEEAHSLGAPGVPTVMVDGEPFWGDDRLEEAAEAVRR